MGINGIAQFLEGLGKKRKIGEEIFRFTEAVADSRKITRARLTLSGEELKLLPKPFREMLKGFKNPTVHMGYQGGKGQATMGIAVTSRNKPVGQFAYNLDKTRGAIPTSQARVRLNLPTNAENSTVAGAVVSINPNKGLGEDFASQIAKQNGKYNINFSRGEAFEFNAQYYPENGALFAEQTGFPMPKTKEIQMFPSQMAEESENAVSEFTALFKPKKAKSVKPKAPKTVKTPAKPITSPAVESERSFLEEAKIIIGEEGKITLENATKAKNLILKKMGYNPENVNVKFSEELTHEGAVFNMETGEVLLNPKFAERGTPFDVSIIMAHELDHFDVAVKMAKKLGLDKFEQLIAHRAANRGTPIKINREFYERAMKDVDVTHFDPTPYIREEQQVAKARLAKPTDDYDTFLDRYFYSVSETEEHARAVERKLLSELQNSDVKIKSSVSLDRFGHTPDKEFIPYFPKVQKSLSKYPLAERNRVFNEAFGQALKEDNEEFYNLLTKLRANGVLEGVESEKYQAFAKKFYTDNNYIAGLLDKVLSKI